MVEELKIADGFHKTDAGVIPNDWKIEPLSKIAHFENGKAHEQFIDEQGDFVVVNSKFISTEGRVRKHSNKNILPLKKGDVTIVMSDIPKGKALAKCFLIDKENKYTLNQRIGGITASKDTDNKYLFYKLNRNKYYLSFDSGTGQTNIKRQEILDCPVALPPTRTEQRAIATALSDMDALIEGLEKLIAKKRNIKQGAMQELLKPKEGWEVKTLGEIGKFSSSSVDKIFREGDEEVYLLNYMDVYNNTVLRKNKINGKTTANKSQIKNFGLIKGDIVFTPTSETPNDIGRAALIANDLDKTVFSYHVVRLRFFSDEIVDILKPYILNCQQLSNFFYEKATGSTRYVLKKSDFENAPIRIPKDNNEQTRIANILSDMDTEIEQLEAQLSKYRQIKAGMMQELLTGKRRLI